MNNINTILPGLHSTDPDVCEWVVEQYENRDNKNLTLVEWVAASKAILEQQIR
jgi:hypothetical protein